MRTVLVGAVASTSVTLRAMTEEGHPPAAVMTLPLELRHRHSDYLDIRPLASRYDIPVIDVADSNDAGSLNALRDLSPDQVWVVGWSQLCGAEFLQIPRFGAIGAHPSRLPENRGRAVIPWTILQGVASTGSTLFWLGQGADDGNIIRQLDIVVAEDETAESLIGKHLEALDRMVREVIQIADPKDIPSIPQDHSRATYCARRVADDGLIDWHLPARDIWRFIRAVGRPYPGAFTFLDGQKVSIWKADFVGARPIWAQPGQVVGSSQDGYLVQCGDREHVQIVEYSLAASAPEPNRFVGRRFRNGWEGSVS